MLFSSPDVYGVIIAGFFLGVCAIWVCCFCESKVERKHRHIETDGTAVYVDPIDGFEHCHCGGGFEYVTGDHNGDGDGDDGGDGGGDVGGDGGGD